MKTSTESEALAKIVMRVIPLLALLYFAAFIDRSNVSFAAEGMNRDLGFSPYVYGLGAGVFFLGYVLFEVPSNLILHRVGARRWIARITLTWALVAFAMVFVHSAASFYIVRFLLGVAEAGLFPGVIYFLTQWVPSSQRARLIGLFMTAIPISTALSGPISSAILTLDGTHGLAGWQWLFLLETIPSLVLGFVTLVMLPNTPAEATWLATHEKTWLIDTLTAEASVRQQHLGASMVRMLIESRVLVFCLAYFGVELALYGVILWLPQIFKSAGVPPALVGYAVSIPYGLAAIIMVLWCRHSDRTKERALHIVAAAALGFLGFVGLAACSCFPGGPLLSLIAITAGAVGTLAILPVFWTLPAARLKGPAAAANLALINAVGNLGGFVGPFLIGWIKSATGSFTYGLLAVAGGLLLTGIVIWPLRRSSVAERVGVEPVAPHA
jgi:MFS transporter, ACS family, tartrate transporter